MVASGYYDMVTPFFDAEYTLNRHGILANQMQYTYYQGGHMMYVNEPSRLELLADTRRFIETQTGIKSAGLAYWVGQAPGTARLQPRRLLGDIGRGNSAHSLPNTTRGRFGRNRGLSNSIDLFADTKSVIGIETDKLLFKTPGKEITDGVAMDSL